MSHRNLVALVAAFVNRNRNPKGYLRGIVQIGEETAPTLDEYRAMSRKTYSEKESKPYVIIYYLGDSLTPIVEQFDDHDKAGTQYNELHADTGVAYVSFYDRDKMTTGNVADGYPYGERYDPEGVKYLFPHPEPTPLKASLGDISTIDHLPEDGNTVELKEKSGSGAGVGIALGLGGLGVLIAASKKRR